MFAWLRRRARLTPWEEARRRELLGWAPHEIGSDGCRPAMHCHWHDVDEPDAGAYRACLECGHVYLTRQALRDAWQAEWPGPGPSPVMVYDPPGCAYCGHDW